MKCANVFQGEISSAGDTFYVVEEGSFLIYGEDNSELAKIGKGSCFGELALLRQVGLMSHLDDTYHYQPICKNCCKTCCQGSIAQMKFVTGVLG